MAVAADLQFTRPKIPSLVWSVEIALPYAESRQG